MYVFEPFGFQNNCVTLLKNLKNENKTEEKVGLKTNTRLAFI